MERFKELCIRAEEQFICELVQSKNENHELEAQISKDNIIYINTFYSLIFCIYGFRTKQ